MLYFILYFAAISLLAVILTVHDKRVARRQKPRVRERTLLLVALFGGAIAMLLAILAVRHKTRHAKFMAGLPMMIALQLGLAAVVWWATR